MQTEKKSNRIAVLIPCYNEGLTIGNVVRDYRQALPDADIYVYDNNSTDETARLAREAGAIVRPEPRQGKGNVVRSMFRDIEADCYLMVDGDDTYPASQAAALCAPVLEGRADMVIGDRLSSTYFTENKRPFHNSGNMLVRRCINMFWKRGQQIEDVMTGMRAMSPLFVKSFPILSQGFEIETEMTIFSLANNFRIASMPIQYRDRPEGSVSKLNTFRDGFRVLKTIADARRDNSPPGGVITPSKSLLHICQQNYKNEGRGNFPPPCFYVLRRCLVNAGSQVAACSSCGLASGFSPLVSRATA